MSISELGAALYEQHVSEIRLPASLQYRIQRVVDTFLKSAQYFNINRAPGKKECAQAAVVHILTKSKILVSANEYIYVSALSHILFAVSLCVLVIWHSYCHGRSGSQELEYNYMMSVDAGAILASLCSEVVDVFEVEARRIVKDLSAVTMATGITTGLCLNLSSNQSTIWWKDEQVMSFIPPNASGSGAILAYVLAIETLRSLLANSYLVHRRY